MDYFQLQENNIYIGGILLGTISLIGLYKSNYLNSTRDNYINIIWRLCNVKAHCNLFLNRYINQNTKIKPKIELELYKNSKKNKTILLELSNLFEKLDEINKYDFGRLIKYNSDKSVYTKIIKFPIIDINILNIKPSKWKGLIATYRYNQNCNCEDIIKLPMLAEERVIGNTLFTPEWFTIHKLNHIYNEIQKNTIINDNTIMNNTIMILSNDKNNKVKNEHTISVIDSDSKYVVFNLTDNKQFIITDNNYIIK